MRKILRLHGGACRLMLIAGFAGVAKAGNPEVGIASGPMFGGASNVPPNLVLALSVEFPTAGIAYRGDGGSYNRSIAYAGYFNPSKCYVYKGGNRNLSDDAYFIVHKDADPATHECGGDSFSGNFMNWAASSAIDMLRYALTGGDRIIDTPDLTVLQRAYLKDSASSNFYAHATYFPRRKLVAGGNASAPNQVTPFDAKTLYIVSCRNRILFSDQSSGLMGNKSEDSSVASKYCGSSYDGTGEPPKEALDKRLGEYLVRVRVCDASEGPARPDLCRKYGGNYKPVGEIQRRSDRVRLAAMGYLLDDAEPRYGGVLRAPMKHVGPKKLDAPDFVQTANDRLEWDEASGVFYANPEDPADRNSTTVNSGVINYLNKFGRLGNYKTLDPVSELYYEAIRYLQGKAPTPDTTAGMTEAMKDGFPVIGKWADPVIASCQQNYILTIADVNTHWDRYVPGNVRTTYGDGKDAHDSARSAEPGEPGKTPDFDIRPWTRRVGEMEVDFGGNYSNPAPNPNLSGLDARDTGAGGHGTYYMAGLAYWANTNDIRIDKPVRVKTFAIDVDEGGNGLIDGNIRTIKPRDSQLYLAAKYGGFEDRNKDGNPFITLAADGKTVLKANNSEWDNNGNGVPANYFLAGQPQEMIQSIRRVFEKIGAASGTISGVSVTSAKVSSDGAFVYQPGFDSSTWSGSLKKLSVKLDEGGGIALATVPEWDAAEILTGKDEASALPKAGERRIYTGRTADAGAWSTVEFRWEKLNDAQKAMLDASSADGVPDGLGEKRLDYLRGQRGLELGHPNGVFRRRDRVLGDIVNSNPLYVAAPALNVQGSGYQEFYEGHKARQPAVYVGANDGMLHAFSASDGKELFAYVPAALMPALGQLSWPDYAHRPYMDGAITVAEAQVGEQWKTVLAAGMGGGAQGVVALDVTDPGGFGSTGALWEFTDADDADIGNVTGAPVIAKFRTKVANGVAQYRHFVVAASGLNNYRDDGKGRFNADAAGALFLLALDKPATAKWELGVNYFKFRTPSKDAKLQNGLSSPALVTDAGGTVRYAYAGDLQGNLWRFNFTGGLPWVAAQPNGKPLFTAMDASGTRQPVTVQPKVVFAPGGGYVVLFGTGKFVESADAAKGSFRTQSFYGIYDTTDPAHEVGGRNELAQVTASKSGSAYALSGEVFSYGVGDKHKKGWYLDLPDSDKTGERVVANPFVANGQLFFNSLIPGSDPCASGSGRSYILDVLTGQASGGVSGFTSQVGMPGAPVAFQTEAEVGDRNAIGRRSVKKQLTVFNFGTGGVKGTAAPAENGAVERVVPAGRFSWREILNWQELRNAFKN